MEGVINTASNVITGIRHAGPNPGIVAAVFCLLKLASLVPVTILVTRPPFPAPYEPAGTISTFFQSRQHEVLILASLQFGAAIPLGIFTASMVSRLRFLG